MSRSEAESALCCSNSPSFAFLVGTVGISLWNSRRFGLILYLTVLTVALLSTLLFNILEQKRHRKERAPLNAVVDSPDKKPMLGATLFTQSVQNATRSMLLICAYVIFFSAFVGTIGLILSRFSSSPLLQGGLFAVLELSGGMSAASEIRALFPAVMLSAFAAGWSGLSIHLQVLSVLDGRGLSFKRYFRAKLLQGILCALVLGALVSWFPSFLFP